MSTYIPAADLLRSFEIFGHFYRVNLGSEMVDCRSVLEIVQRSLVPPTINEMSKRDPDAVFIMMNPGSSRPLVEVENVLRASELSRLKVNLVPTKPDTTQYQLMRVMIAQQWKHVRVVNLSDLRSTKSPEFCKLFRRLEEQHQFVAHSVFCDERRGEMLQKLPQRRQTPLVFAWGLSEKLTPLIERCVARVSKHPVTYGLSAEGSAHRYRHPLPTLQSAKVAWVNEMIEQLQS